MKQFKGVRVINAVTLLVLSIALGWAASDLYIRPILTQELHLDGAEFRPGEVLNYTVTFYRRKACKTNVEQFVYAELAPHKIKTYYRGEFPGLLVMGDNTIYSSVKLPDSMPPGTFRFLTQLASFCGFITRVDPYPEATITVR